MDVLGVADWRRAVSELYADIRRSTDPEDAWNHWVVAREELFRSHPQSPLPAEQRVSFQGLSYYPYEPSARVIGRVEPTDPEAYEIRTSDDQMLTFTRFARVDLELKDRSASLELYWLEGYGGGLFLPFRDATSGSTTYGAGRYLLDTAKGADLGMAGDGIVCDFNFAYNPSCSYDPRWSCPLAPPPNRLQMAIEAGERTR